MGFLQRPTVRTSTPSLPRTAARGFFFCRGFALKQPKVLIRLSETSARFPEFPASRGGLRRWVFVGGNGKKVLFRFREATLFPVLTTHANAPAVRSVGVFNSRTPHSDSDFRLQPAAVFEISCLAGDRWASWSRGVATSIISEPCRSSWQRRKKLKLG